MRQRWPTGVPASSYINGCGNDTHCILEAARVPRITFRFVENGPTPLKPPNAESLRELVA